MERLKDEECDHGDRSGVFFDAALLKFTETTNNVVFFTYKIAIGTGRWLKMCPYWLDMCPLKYHDIKKSLKVQEKSFQAFLCLY